MKCPRCSDASLTHETYEGISIDRCPTCKGTWLDEGELLDIVEIEEKTFGIHLKTETLQKSFAGVTDEEVNTDVPCPKCATAMKAINYVYSSGIIIDRCPENHGTWLDGKELEKVQVYKEEWNKKIEPRKKELTKLAADAGARVDAEMDAEEEKIASQYLFGSALNKIFDLL